MCDLLLEESNVQPVSTPITVCGDIHGQVCTLESDNDIGDESSRNSFQICSRILLTCIHVYTCTCTSVYVHVIYMHVHV